MRGAGKFFAVFALAAISTGLKAQDDPTAERTTAVYGPTTEARDVARLPLPFAIPAELDAAASRAAVTHPSVNAAEAEAEALDAEYRAARWGRYPSLSVEALAATEGSSLSDQDGLAINARVEQPIWAGGRIGSEIDRAQASLRVGEDRVDEASRDIVLRVVSAYYGFVLAAEQISVLEASLAQHEELLSAIGRRVEREVSPEADRILGQSRTAQVEFDLASALESRDAARLRLSELTGGADIDPVLPPSGLAATLPAEEIALAEALDCSPSLAALTDLIGVAEAQSDIARAQLLPQLLLQVSQNEITGARAAVVLRAQFGPGQAQRTAIEASDARILRAMADYADTERTVREELRRDYVLVRAAERRIASGILAADASDEIIASYQRQFIAGRRSWLDVMNAVREAANARLSETEARVAAAAATARILAVACRWQPAGQEDMY